MMNLKYIKKYNFENKKIYCTYKIVSKKYLINIILFNSFISILF